MPEEDLRNVNGRAAIVHHDADGLMLYDRCRHGVSLQPPQLFYKEGSAGGLASDH